MRISNQIWFIDDDAEDFDLIRMIAEELNIKMPLLLVKTGKQMMDYLHETLKIV